MAWTTPGTATAGDVLTAAFWNTQVRDQFIELAPFMSAWTAYTPGLGGGWGQGNGTLTGSYIKVGRWVACRFELTFGSTSTYGAGAPTITLPFNAAAGFYSNAIVDLVDSGTDNYIGNAYLNPGAYGVGAVGIRVMRVDGTYTIVRDVTNTVPFTWTTNDKIYNFQPIIYQAAS